MLERGIQVRLKTIVAFVLLGCASSAAQTSNIKLIMTEFRLLKTSCMRSIQSSNRQG